jgi:alpha-glucosidase
MKHSRSLLIYALLISSSLPVLAQVKQSKLLSPDKKIELNISIKNDHLEYQVNYKGKSVIDASSLSLVVNGNTLGEATSFGDTKTGTINETYAWRGYHSKAVNYCNTLSLKINVAGDKSFTIEARTYNNGVAFRYIVPGTSTSIINADNTGFTIPKGSTVWSQNNIHAYEGKYQEQKINDIPAGQLAGPPLTFKLPSALGYASITEGGLTDFAGMSLIAQGDRKFKANLTGTVNKQGIIETPWRIIEIGADLNTLLNCDIVQNVSPAPDPTLFPDGFNTSWVKPGRSTWSWLAGNGGVTFENMKKFSKWAGELGFEYNLVDEGWSRWQDGDKDKWALLKELTQYAETQHVKTWIWKAYPDRAGVPGLKHAEDRIAFFKKCKEVGVVGLKIDFFDTESQEVIDFYQAALKDAAELHLMLDFHGANKPTGESRTWPNEMSREGIRGLENGTSWPKHNTTLLFTRYLAGHGDYTPLSFRTVVKGTTVTHQVATVAAFNSPFMCLAVNPEALLSHPARKIVSAIPVTWDETIVLPPSEIGELALLAKRSGSTWYVVALNGESAKNVNVDLSFLGKGDYKATTMEDTDNDPTVANIKEGVKFNAKTKLKISLQAGGGYVAAFSKQ